MYIKSAADIPHTRPRLAVYRFQPKLTRTTHNAAIKTKPAISANRTPIEGLPNNTSIWSDVINAFQNNAQSIKITPANINETGGFVSIGKYLLISHEARIQRGTRVQIKPDTSLPGYRSRKSRDARNAVNSKTNTSRLGFLSPGCLLNQRMTVIIANRRASG